MATQTKNRNLKFVYWNADGVQGKKPELQHFIEEEDVDVMLLGETWLRNNHNFKIPNYHTYRTDRLQQPRGGTAILIKRSITIISVYSSPNMHITLPDLQSLLLPNEKTIILGDLNAKNQL